MCEPLPRSSPLVVAGHSRAGQEPTLDDGAGARRRLRRRLQTALRGIVAEEPYRQNVISAAPRPGRRARTAQGRQLESDLLLVKLGDDESWMQFRDVFEVDRKPVRDRDQRLYKLFVDAKADARRAGRNHPGGKRALQPRPDHAHHQHPDHGAVVLRAGNQSGLQFEQGRPATSSASRTWREADDIWMIEFREIGRGHDGQGREQPRHPVARPRLARQRHRPHPADRTDQRRHRPARRDRRLLQGGAGPRSAGARRDARDLPDPPQRDAHRRPRHLRPVPPVHRDHHREAEVT